MWCGHLSLRSWVTHIIADMWLMFVGVFDSPSPLHRWSAQRLRSCLPRQLRSSSQSSPSERGSTLRTTRDARYRSDTRDDMCEQRFRRSFFSPSGALPWSDHVSSYSLLAPSVGIVTSVHTNNYTSSYFLLYISTIFFFLTPLPYPCSIGLFAVPVSVYIHKQRPPYQHPLEDHPSV